MERPEDCSVIPTTAPVFVDDSGRRGTLARRAARILMVGFTAYLGLLGAGLARDPRLGPLHLPTFGLPTLALAPPPAPAVLGGQTARTATDTEVAAGATEASPSGAPPAVTATGAGTGPAGGTGSAARVPVVTRRAVVTPTTTAPTTTTGAPTDPGQGSKGSTTTTSSTTTPVTTPAGQSTTVASGKGPDGSGPPGQERKPTTPTTGRRAAG
jgi:hypothetical protein